MAFTIFFAFGAAVSGLAAISLLYPHSFLEPIWQIKPAARTSFASFGLWAIVLLSFVSIACGTAAIGIWRGARWAHVLAIILISINLIGDVANYLLGIEPRAIVGVPIAAAMLWYLIRHGKRSFSGERNKDLSRQ